MSLRILTALIPGPDITPVIFLAKVPRGTIRSEHDASVLEKELRTRVYPSIESPMVFLDGEDAEDRQLFGPNRLKRGYQRCGR